MDPSSLILEGAQRAGTAGPDVIMPGALIWTSWGTGEAIAQLPPGFQKWSESDQECIGLSETKVCQNPVVYYI